MSGGHLEVEALTVTYGAGVAVDAVSLEVPAGGCLGIVGANGAGKSSLMNCVCGRLRPAAGRIALDGRDVTRRGAWKLARMGLRAVPETKELFWGLTVAENLRAGAASLPRSRREQELARVLELLPRLQELQRSTARDLSGGEQQLVAIGRAMVGRPRLLLLDEPALGLSPIAVSHIVDCLRAIRAEGTTIVIAEQSLRVPDALADELCVMQLGRVVAHGGHDEVLQGELLRQAFLGGGAPAVVQAENMREEAAT
ncbi:ABC transporter ATP-binding protein [Conexibacter sp. CPCC 206217]|uniref:ABC transporter ATP-binding protein n=1 Tax=Conexibacter sp. CPCC 206217 TaxID=3064574 RepID=UPI00271CBCEF|nr:ABC transporter ATP-binding protein [Conexibacter sp. CPCC 206217]MDO8211097.1 ABC transporter ATP-binding protein [Conexibacter sp. CPCC 206217]